MNSEVSREYCTGFVRPNRLILDPDTERDQKVIADTMKFAKHLGICPESKLSDGSKAARLTGCDVVTSVGCPVWPHEADEWPARQRRRLDARGGEGWPSASTVDQCVSAGCRLVGKPSEKISKKDIFRFSFSSAETQLIRSMTPCQIFVFNSLKRRLKDAKRLSRCSKQNNLSSYHVKSMVFWAVEENSSPESWSDVDDRIRSLVARFVSHLIDRSLPHYFIKDVNLLADLEYDDDNTRVDVIIGALISGVDCDSNDKIVMNNPSFRIPVSNNLVKAACLLSGDTVAIYQTAMQELYDLFSGINAHRAAMITGDLKERSQLLDQAKQYLMQATSDSSNKEMIEFTLSKSLIEALITAQKTQVTSTGRRVLWKTWEHLRSKTVETSRSIHVCRDSVDNYSLWSEEDHELLKKSITQQFNKDFNMVISLPYLCDEYRISKYIMSSALKVVFMRFVKSGLSFDPNEIVNVVLPGRISLPAALSLLANVYYLTENYHRAMETCDILFMINENRFLYRFCIEFFLPLSLSSHWASIFDGDIQCLIGCLELARYSCRHEIPGEYHDTPSYENLFICPVVFAYYVKMRCLRQLGNVSSGVFDKTYRKCSFHCRRTPHTVIYRNEADRGMMLLMRKNMSH